MALYICPVCPWKGREHKYDLKCSGETTLSFENGNIWTFPNIVLHYVEDHAWLPPDKFVNDVLQGNLLLYRKTELAVSHRRIGYFTEESFYSGDIPDLFVQELESLMRKVEMRDRLLNYEGLGER